MAGEIEGLTCVPTLLTVGHFKCATLLTFYSSASPSPSPPRAQTPLPPACSLRILADLSASSPSVSGRMEMLT